MKAVKVSQNVYWVGAVDWGLRDFHGYSTERGTTYNAYFVICRGNGSRNMGAVSVVVFTFLFVVKSIIYTHCL